MQGSKHKLVAFAKRWAQAAKHKGTAASEQILLTGNCVQDPATHKYVVAPAVDGRITLVGPHTAAAAAAAAAAAGAAAEQ